MKILHVIDSGGLYGAEVMLLNLAAEQVRQGMEPTIASIGDPHLLEKPLEAEAIRRGIRVKVFRMRPGPNIVGALEVLRFAWRGKYDLLHSHGYKGNILFGMLPRSIRRIPMVTTLHGWTGTGGVNRMALYEWLDSLSLGFIDRVVLVNEAMRGHVRLKKHQPSKWLVVNNGISLDEDTPGGDVALDQRIVDFCRGGFAIGAIGRLSPEKGYGILLDAVKIVADMNPDIRLVILGAGGERSALETKIVEQGLEERVLMPGYVADAKRYLPFFKLFVLSSLTEGLPIVILEAMLSGVPIVATRVGGVPEILDNGGAGILVNSVDATALSEGIIKLIKEPGLRSRLAENAKQLVRKGYSSNRMAEEYQRIYCDLLSVGY